MRCRRGRTDPAPDRHRQADSAVTNDASKLPSTAAARYVRFGLAVPAERIVTSGELLQGYFAEHRLAGAARAVLGTRDSVRYVELAGGRLTAADADFDVLVIGDETGYPFLETVDQALTALFHRLDAGCPVHLLLPNPDLIYPRGARSFGITAGSIALMLEAALQRRFGATGAALRAAGQAGRAPVRGGHRPQRRGTRRDDRRSTRDRHRRRSGGRHRLGARHHRRERGAGRLPSELRPTWQLASVALEGGIGDDEDRRWEAPDEIDK